MRKCELCGLENPDEARFCMKCGKDLDPVTSIEVPPEMLEPSTFTPAAAEESARLAPGRPSLNRADPADIEVYKQAASESAQSIEQQATWQEHFADEPSEIQQTDVTADFVVKAKSCNRCGAANPHEQRYCKQCGAAFEGHVPSMADDNFKRAPAIQMAATVDHSYLSDVSPSAGYQDVPPANQPAFRERRERTGAMSDWGVREWLMIIVAVLLVSGIVWFFFFGGKDALFKGLAGNVHKAGQAMEDLGSFEMSVGITFESVQAGQSGGAGKVMFEKPHSDYWESTFSVMGKPYLVGLIQVDRKVYQTVPGGSGWQTADPGTTTGDVLGFWRDVSAVEDLGNQTVGATPCYHYRYRVPARYVTSPLGASNQQGVSDAVVESWIDLSTFKVMRMTAGVYGLEYEGQRFNARLDMVLGATGQPYGIKPPI